MAKKAEEKYQSRAMVNRISATSRCSVKIGDNFYTVEYEEDRILPVGIADNEIALEREMLWDTVNNECDGQVVEILRTFKRRK